MRLLPTPDIGPMRKRFKRTCLSRIANPSVRQALLLVRYGDGSYDRIAVLNSEETVSRTIADLEWAKFNIFEDWIARKR